MTIPAIDWRALAELEGANLKGQIFDILQGASRSIQTRPLDDPELLGLVPRLAELIESRTELASFREVYSAFARSVGLWNYIDKQEADARDEIVAQAATSYELNVTLHREQVAALNSLLSGNNLILSAPTSFGKSILVDALLAESRYGRIAVVLPTIALLDEFRRRLVARFGDQYDVLMHHSERPVRNQVIFLGTQERLINRDDLGNLDLVVVDEFYKLDPTRKDDRSVTLNAAVYKLLGRAKQFFFLGPNIDSVTISADSRWKFDFLRTRFSTVAVDTYDLNSEKDKPARLLSEAYNKGNWPALIFVSSPDKANQLANELLEAKQVVGNGAALAQWMDRNYGSQWELSEAVKAGIAVHHGRIPRALASQFVRMFNDNSLPILICTSTLIEGVNTAAKSVLIYDKKIDRSNYDFFTFSNIRGRAGRLGQHLVGQVYLFHESPSPDNVEVTAPLFGDLEDAPPEFVVHVEPEDATPDIEDRVSELASWLELEPVELRRYSSIGVDLLASFKQSVEQILRGPHALSWRNRPDYAQILAVCEVIASVVPIRSFGVVSPRQLALYINNLRTHATMRGFYQWHASSYRGQPSQLDNVFKFLRALKYSLPEYFSVVQMFVQKKGVLAEYELFVAEMPRWFRAEALKILEEQGVAIQIAERFLERDDTVTLLGERLRKLALQEDPRLAPLERNWILDALPA